MHSLERAGKGSDKFVWTSLSADLVLTFVIGKQSLYILPNWHASQKCHVAYLIMFVERLSIWLNLSKYSKLWRLECPNLLCRRVILLAES